MPSELFTSVPTPALLTVSVFSYSVAVVRVTSQSSELC